MWRVALQVLWLPVIIACYNWGYRALPQTFWWMFANNLWWLIVFVIQLFYVQHTVYVQRTTEARIRRLVNEATDAVDDELRDPRDNAPYERFHTP